MEKQVRRLSIFILGLAAFSGCGKQAYVVTTSSQCTQAPGHFMVPPKVDVLLAEDDTGSIKEIYPTIARQMPDFLQSLETKGWDYHFATTPLTTDRAMDQVVGSQYDANHPNWTAPYPGAARSAPGTPGTIDSNVFRIFSEYSGFIQYGETSQNGQEPGFETIRQALYNRAPGTGFVRPDAMLVVLVVGNGNDTSGVKMCPRGDGFSAPCEQIGYPGTATSSFNNYKSQFLALKNSPSQLKFYSAVSSQKRNYCLGSGAYAGTRYMQMAAELGGQSYDICSQPVSSVLNEMSNHLQATKIAFRTRYLFIDQEPNQATIKVLRQVGGCGNSSVEIPQDPNNGWTYAGEVSNVASIDYPAPMGLASGYAIELHGSAKLQGDDTATVEFLPVGVQPSVSN